MPISGNSSPTRHTVEFVNQSAIQQDSGRKLDQYDLHGYSYEVNERSRSNLHIGPPIKNTLNSIETDLARVRQRTVSYEPEFKTIQMNDVEYTDLASRQRIFEDVIIQRIKVI